MWLPRFFKNLSLYNCLLYFLSYCAFIFICDIIDIWFWFFKAPTQILAGGQGLRLAAPGSTTVLRTMPAGQVAQLAQMQGGKQIITVKAGQVSVSNSQPQIVTLVKTTQGMQVAPVSILYFH